MAGQIFRALQRNPDFINSLAQIAGEYTQRKERETQYQAIQDLLNPVTTEASEELRPKMGSLGTLQPGGIGASKASYDEKPPAQIPLKGGGTATMPYYQGNETIRTPQVRTPRSALDLSSQEMLRLGSILKMPAVNAFNMLASQEAEERKRRMPQKDNLSPGTVPGMFDPMTGKWSASGPQAPFQPRDPSYNPSYLAMLAASGDKEAMKAVELLRPLQRPGATQWQQARDKSGKPRIEAGEGGMSFYVEEAVGEPSMTRLGKPATEKPAGGGGAANTDRRAWEKEKRALEQENENITSNEKRMWSNLSTGEAGTNFLGQSKGSQVVFTNEGGKQVKITDRAAADALLQSLHGQSETRKEKIRKNQERVKELDARLGGTWKGPETETTPAAKPGKKAAGY